MALKYPYPTDWGMDTRMNFIPPITSPSQGSNRVLPSWGGAGTHMSEGVKGLAGGVGSSLTLGDITIVRATDIVPAWVGGAYSVLRLGLIGVGAYHGYERNQSVASSIGYGALAAFLPLIAMGTMAAQGIAERK
jgi:hypothetical protein